MMLLQNIKTPLTVKRPKKPRKACKRSIDDQIADFMAFESGSTGHSDLKLPNQDGKSRTEFLEDRIEAYLSSKSVAPGDPKSKKDEYFLEMKLNVENHTSQQINYEASVQLSQSSPSGCISLCSLSVRRQTGIRLPNIGTFGGSSNKSNMMPKKISFSVSDYRPIIIKPRSRYMTDSKMHRLYEF